MSPSTTQSNLLPTSKPFAVAWKASRSQVPPPVVTDFYGWGPWVNGGAWVQTFAGKLDLLYRNMDQLQRVLDESQEGIYHHDFYQQPTFGFVSVIYLAETKSCSPIMDPRGLLSGFKRQVEVYPARLRKKLIGDLLWMAEFTFLHADGFAERIDIFNTVGCLGPDRFYACAMLYSRSTRNTISATKAVCKPSTYSAEAGAIFPAPAGGVGTPDAESTGPSVCRSSNARLVARSRRSHRRPIRPEV